MPKKAQQQAVGGVELLTPENPPPSVDDSSVPLFDESHEAKKSAQGLDEKRRSFFADPEDKAPAAEPKPAPARKQPAAKKPAAKPEPEPDRALFTDYMTEAEVGEHADKLVDELDEGAPPEAGDQEQPPAEGEPGAEEPAAEPEVEAQPQEFRNADGMRYRVRGPDGKYTDLSALEGAVIEVPFNGEYRPVPADKVPNLIGLGLLYSSRTEAIRDAANQLQQREYTLQQREQQLSERESDVERFFVDPDYAAQVQQEWERGRTPEGRLEAEQRRRHATEEEVRGRDRETAQQMVLNNEIAPRMTALVKAAPLLGQERVEEMLTAMLGQFGHRDLELRRNGNGWVPVNWPAWNRFQQVLREDWPRRVRAEQAKLAELVGDQKKQSDIEVRKAKAEADAATTKAELSRRAVGSKVPSTAGHAPSREQPRHRIKTIQDGRKWLRGED